MAIVVLSGYSFVHGGIGDHFFNVGINTGPEACPICQNNSNFWGKVRRKEKLSYIASHYSNRNIVLQI